ncbi:MAG TPA: gamma carbonic anhydrase family protein [Mesorhizobium sp.]|jgi:carbonic anhydrase/acetyltransferase-like protein (isoleucine patch superfamily)|nr:gamma carbonic anhydrase family protein [Mesorhizobium sp.]
MPIYALDGVSPDIDPTAWIAPDAAVIGKVRLGPRSSVWFGAVLRGDNEWIEVGAGSNIQEHCMLHTDPGFPLAVGENCTVGHRAILHGCTVQRGSLIGMGTIVLNGAAIGAESLVGAGALVTEGKTFPARSLLVGSPARAVRELDDAAAAGLEASALHYSQNARRFRERLTLLPSG